MSSLEMPAELSDDLRSPSRVVWLSALAVVVFFVWAAFASVDEIVRGQGALVSSSRPQVVQTLEGGILAELLVQEGDLIEEGAVIARLHATQFQSSVDEIADQLTALEVRRLRLDAELAGQFDFTVPDELATRRPDLVESERTLLRARQQDYVSRSEGAARVLAQAEREKTLLEDLLERKIVALIEVTRARKAYADAKIRYDDIVTQTELERAEAYSTTLKEMTVLRQSLRAAQDQLTRTALRAPMRGIVNRLGVTTIGGVLQPGAEIAEIIPLGEDLFVEARVSPKDIAGVRPGQTATIKLSAYDYTVFGSLKGEVDFISADTVEADREEEPHYKLTLRVDQTGFTDRQRAIEMRPGMLAEVELLTGEKTILRYLLKPLYKSQEAFREP